jgi:hypothetical protein
LSHADLPPALSDLSISYSLKRIATALKKVVAREESEPVEAGVSSRGLNNLDAIVRRVIQWVKVVGAPRWACSIDGTRADLLMGDFLDEPLYTLKFKGHRLDLDEASENWIIPRA